MNIEKEIQEAFEQFHAKDCNCNYEDLKRQLDRQEMLTGHRYLPTSPRHEAWLVFHAGWLASKQHEAKKLEGCVVVPKTIPDNVVESLKNSSYHWGDQTRNYFSPIYEMMVVEAARGGNHE